MGFFSENSGINDTNLFEGDMILTPEQQWKAMHEIDVDSSSDRKRGSSRLRLWPGGIIVYAIDWRLGKCFINHVTLFLKLYQSVNN